MPDLSPLWISARVAALAVGLMLPCGTAAAWWLARGGRRRFGAWCGLVEVVLMLPLVLPPTVVGYYLLLALGRGTAFGLWLNDAVGLRLLFTWEGAAVAASVMAFPLYVRSATAAFGAVDTELLEVGRTLGAGEAALLRHVTVPLAYRGVLAGLALALARALGEFGATLMVAGSIPGRTQTLPLALYASVQAGADRDAALYTALLTAFAFALLAAVGLYQGRVAALRAEG